MNEATIDRIKDISVDLVARIERAHQLEDAWARMNDQRGQAMLGLAGSSLVSSAELLNTIDTAMNVCGDDLTDEYNEIGRLVCESRRLQEE